MRVVASRFLSAAGFLLHSARSIVGTRLLNGNGMLCNNWCARRWFAEGYKH